MNRLAILLVTVLLVNFGLLRAQKLQFKTYANSKDKFSFDIPNYWAVKFSKAAYGFICEPVIIAEKSIYKDCFEGIVFRLFVYDTTLNATLINDGYKKSGNSYTTSDKFGNNVIARPLKGKNWAGVYHQNVCGIRCKVNVQKVDGTCDFLYFSKGNKTVCITTNGKEFKKEVLERLERSFIFK